MIRGELAELVEELTAAREPFVEATVVRAQRPTSVRAGDAGDRPRATATIEGFVGGACAESSVRLHALRALETGEPMLLRILPGDAAEAADRARGRGDRQQPLPERRRAGDLPRAAAAGGTVRVVGRDPIGRAIAELGERVGYAVELDAAEESEPRADDAAVVVASHGHDEERVLAAALRRRGALRRR